MRADAPVEKEVVCPYCGEAFTAVIDPSVDDQEYVEDCYVCCRPIQFAVTCAQGEVQTVEATRAQ